LFPGKPIVIGEVGWPSNGRTRESAVASEANEALFLRRFLAHASREGWIYYVMEAFDQPWKSQIEGAVGAYWGVYDVERQPKFPFTGRSCGCRSGAVSPAVRDRRAVVLACCSSTVARCRVAAVASSRPSCTRRRRRRLGVL
jgi:hypothetical protein